jgi:hypothetical protein
MLLVLAPTAHSHVSHVTRLVAQGTSGVRASPASATSVPMHAVEMTACISETAKVSLARIDDLESLQLLGSRDVPLAPPRSDYAAKIGYIQLQGTR